MAKNVPGLKRGFHYDPVARDLGIYVNGVQVESYSERAGRDYYVNNITGASTNDGRSWGAAFDEVSTAITASETYRALGGGAPTVTTNDYVRNRIFVQGTGTAYTKITELPLYCDLIGVGADARGTNQGVARIGSDTVAEGGVVVTDTTRGLNVYNIQFQAGKDMYCFSIENMYRSKFVNCTFMTNGAATGNPTAAFFSGVGSGSLVFQDCLVGGSSCSNQTEPLIGFKIAGNTWNNCLVENCFIAGTQGVTVASTVNDSFGSIFKNNFIGTSSKTCTICVNDDQTTGEIIYAGNYLLGSGVVLDIEHEANRAIGNYEKGALVAANA